MRTLVFGSVNGNYETLCDKIESAIKKTGAAFDICICIGDFFGNDIDFSDFNRVLQRLESLKCELYILNDSSNVPKISKDVSTNLNFLLNFGIVECSNGLNIAFCQDLSTMHQNKSSAISDLLLRNEALQKSKPNYKGIDILLTIHFPKYINDCCDNKSKEKFDKTDSNSYYEEISFIASKICPRYHISQSNVFIERIPYRNHIILQEKPALPTRFISMPPLVNNDREKSVYAFNITQLSSMDPNQLLEEIKSKISDQTLQSPYPRFDNSEIDKVAETKLNKKQYFYSEEKKAPRNNSTHFDCWFCLKNPKIEKHLIVYQDDEAYITLPKGPVSDDHFMICCNDHYQSQIMLPSSVESNVQKIKRMILNYFKKQGKFCLFTERNYKSQHMTIDCIGLDNEYLSRLERMFCELSSANNITLEEFSGGVDLKKQIQPNKPYYYCEYEDLILICKRMNKFPLNFTRQVVCCSSILDATDKIDWKSCVLEHSAELSSALKYRDIFNEF